MGIEGASFLLKYQKLKSLPLEYESDNRELNQKLETLAWIYRSMIAGLLVVILGVLIELSSMVDA